jgi:hypothetical protein
LPYVQGLDRLVEWVSGVFLKSAKPKELQTGILKRKPDPPTPKNLAKVKQLFN